MKIPQIIKGRNKIRDAKICTLWADDLKTSEELGEQFKLTARRIRTILYNNSEFLKVQIDWEKSKRVQWLKKQIGKLGDSKKDSADLMEQLRKEIEGDKALIDNSKHYHFSATNLQTARERVLNGID